MSSPGTNPLQNLTSLVLYELIQQQQDLTAPEKKEGGIGVLGNGVQVKHISLKDSNIQDVKKLWETGHLALFSAEKNTFYLPQASQNLGLGKKFTLIDENQQQREIDFTNAATQTIDEKDFDALLKTLVEASGEVVTEEKEQEEENKKSSQQNSEARLKPRTTRGEQKNQPQDQASLKALTGTINKIAEGAFSIATGLERADKRTKERIEKRKEIEKDEEYRDIIKKEIKRVDATHQLNEGIEPQETT